MSTYVKVQAHSENGLLSAMSSIAAAILKSSRHTCLSTFSLAILLPGILDVHEKHGHSVGSRLR